MRKIPKQIFSYRFQISLGRLGICNTYNLFTTIRVSKWSRSRSMSNTRNCDDGDRVLLSPARHTLRINQLSPFQNNRKRLRRLRQVTGSPILRSERGSLLYVYPQTQHQSQPEGEIDHDLALRTWWRFAVRNNGDRINTSAPATNARQQLWNRSQIKIIIRGHVDRNELRCLSDIVHTSHFFIAA